MSSNWPNSYTLMLRESKRTGLPAHYEEDLTVHDFDRLTGDDVPAVFGWVLRESGTYLIDPRMKYASLSGYLNYLGGTGAVSTNRFYVYDGQSLISVDFERFARSLYRWNSEHVGVENLRIRRENAKARSIY